MISNEITNEYLKTFHYKEKVPLKCQRCQADFTKPKHDIQNNLRRGRNIYCSRSCNSHAQNEKRGHGTQYVICDWCGLNFKKKKGEIKKTKHSFCNRSCSANWCNKHKTTGYRRSKLELFLENKIKFEFPSLKITTNNRTVIGLELDIFLPEISLAIEINGVFHYKPIYGINKFKRIQEIDSQKIYKCKNLNIELLIIKNIYDTFTTDVGEKCWNNLKQAIINKSLKNWERCLNSNQNYLLMRQVSLPKLSPHIYLIQLFCISFLYTFRNYSI